MTRGTPDPRQPLVQVRDLAVHFDQGAGGLVGRLTGGDATPRVIKAVDGVTIDIHAGETLGLVGESGCGKSTFGRALLRLTHLTRGEVWFDGVDLAALSNRDMRANRQRMQVIFQDPYASLNPRLTVGQIVAEPIENFGLAAGRDKDDRVRQLLETVGLDARHINRYPHEFSGGQQQRIGIARALSVDPDFIVADEPISALDVSIQAQIINLIEQLQEERRLTYLFISHDLRAIRHTSDRIAVMYLGRLVELGPAETVYSRSLMPYTQALVSAVPVPDPTVERSRPHVVLDGDVASPLDPPSGCHFHPRCPYAVPECRVEEPRLREITPGHFVACIRVSPEQPDIKQNHQHD